jgi:hypothetical protein
MVKRCLFGSNGTADFDENQNPDTGLDLFLETPH